jgi:hypothetical protein
MASFSLHSLTNDVLKHEILASLWKESSERYAVYTFGFVNRSCLALVLDCLNIWAKKEDEDVEVNSWALFKALVFGGQYGLLRDVFTSFDRTPEEILDGLGAFASPLSLQSLGEGPIRFRPLAFFRFGWEKLRSCALRRYWSLVTVVLLHDDPHVLPEFFEALRGMRVDPSLEFYKIVAQRNCPRLLRHFLGGGTFPENLLLEVFLHDHPIMWEVALLKVHPMLAYGHALEQARFHALSFLGARLKSREKHDIIKLILRRGDDDEALFHPIWGSFNNDLDMFRVAWQSLGFVALPPPILKRVAEHCGHLKNTIELVSFTSHLARDIRYLPLIEHLPHAVLKDVASDLLEAEANEEYFNALLGLCREDITGCLFDAVVGAGNVPFFLHAQEQFSTLKVDLKHMLSLLRHGAVEILTALLPRYALDADVVKLVHQIAASEKCDARMNEAARLVLTDPRAGAFAEERREE